MWVASVARCCYDRYFVSEIYEFIIYWKNKFSSFDNFNFFFYKY